MEKGEVGPWHPRPLCSSLSFYISTISSLFLSVEDVNRGIPSPARGKAHIDSWSWLFSTVPRGAIIADWLQSQVDFHGTSGDENLKFGARDSFNYIPSIISANAWRVLR